MLEAMHSPLLDPRLGPDALPGAVLLDARAGAHAYAAGHLRGALHADLERHLSTASEPGTHPANGGRHPLPPLERWRAQVGAWGIGPRTPVVVYDDKSGANAAARAWWMLRALGHRTVQVLDGGLQAALEAGWEVTTEVSQPLALGPYPANAWQLPTVDAAAVDALRSLPDARVLDVRAAPRYRGETEPLDPVAGHIPGAVNLPFTENLEGSRFKAPEALRAQYLALLGGVAPERLAVHCGSGVTACHTLLALEVAGLQGASLYVGSWSEWCRQPRPRA
jgi:thiosulfate/3-mercaptopyruvate sulfurtransferase